MVSAVGPHARTAAITGPGGTRLWDTALGRWTAASAVFPGLRDVHLTDDGRTFLITDGNGLRLTSVTDGRALFEAPAPRSTAGAVSEDGRCTAACPAARRGGRDSADRGGTTERSPSLWDAAAHRPLSGAWQQDRQCHVGHTRRRPATVGHAHRAADRLTPHHPGEAVYTLAFATDGTTLYAGSAHVPVQRCDLDPVHALSRVCARAGTTLSRAQWHAYVPDTPYRRVCRTS
jgi:hypothetical protein